MQVTDKQLNRSAKSLAKKHNLKIKRNFKYRQIVNFLLAKFHITAPSILYEDVGVLFRFITRVYDKDRINKALIENAIIKSINMSNKAEQKIRKRASIHIYNEKIKRKITPPRWDEIASFFNLEIDELKIVCKLPSKKFYASSEWRYLRYHTVKKRGQSCECCGAGVKNGVIIHVDHILPRSVYVEHALNMANLQVLCEFCNKAKSNIDTTDWRGDQ